MKNRLYRDGCNKVDGCYLGLFVDNLGQPRDVLLFLINRPFMVPFDLLLCCSLADKSRYTAVYYTVRHA